MVEQDSSTQTSTPIHGSKQVSFPWYRSWWFWGAVIVLAVVIFQTIDFNKSNQTNYAPGEEISTEVVIEEDSI